MENLTTFSALFSLKIHSGRGGVRLAEVRSRGFSMASCSMLRGRPGSLGSCNRRGIVGITFPPQYTHSGAGHEAPHKDPEVPVGRGNGY